MIVMVRCGQWRSSDPLRHPACDTLSTWHAEPVPNELMWTTRQQVILISNPFLEHAEHIIWFVHDTNWMFRSLNYIAYFQKTNTGQFYWSWSWLLIENSAINIRKRNNYMYDRVWVQYTIIWGSTARRGGAITSNSNQHRNAKRWRFSPRTSIYAENRTSCDKEEAEHANSATPCRSMCYQPRSCSTRFYGICSQAEVYFSIYSESRSALSTRSAIFSLFPIKQKTKTPHAFIFCNLKKPAETKNTANEQEATWWKKFNLTKLWYSTFKLHAHTHVSPMCTISERRSRRLTCGMNIFEPNLKIGHGMPPMG